MGSISDYTKLCSFFRKVYRTVLDTILHLFGYGFLSMTLLEIIAQTSSLQLSV